MGRILLILFIAMLSSSCKDDRATIANSITGKLKALTMVDSSRQFTYKFYFFYDPTNALLSRINWNDREYAKLTFYQTYFTIDYCQYNRDTVCTGYSRIKIYINENQKRITKISSIDSSTLLEKEEVSFFITNDKPDFIVENLAGERPFSESRIYDIILNNGNITKAIQATNNFFSGQRIDTFYYEYNTLENFMLLPAQLDFPTKYFISTGALPLDPIYVLGLNGYSYCKPNQNLLSNLNNVYIYQYTLNSMNQVVKMHLFGNQNYNHYEMEYY